MEYKKLLLVFNPQAGKAEFAQSLFEVVDRFTKAGYAVTAYPTQAVGDAYQIITSRASDFDILCCSGGDGTLNEAINAIVRLERRPLFGYIPSGTTNDFATSLKIPKNIMEATDTIITGNPFAVDTGRFEEEHFAYVAAFGLFTEVTYGTSQAIKNVLGHAAYILEGVKRLYSIKAYECKIYADDEIISGNFIFAMVSNSASVGGFQMLPENIVSLDDGLFEVLLVKRPKSFIDLQNIIASMLGGQIYTDSLIIRKVSKIRVKSKTTIDWTLDGEYGGSTTDVTITNMHRAMEIIVPK